jgi:hypothetical protein
MIRSSFRRPGGRARPAAMADRLPLDAAQIESLLIAPGIGLLIGLERERVPSARVGLRTFALVGMLGCWWRCWVSSSPALRPLSAAS